MNNNIDRLNLWNGNKSFKLYNPASFLNESLINTLKKISDLSDELKDYYYEFFKEFNTKFIDKNKESLRWLRNTGEHFIERIYGVNSHGKKIKKKSINKFGIYADESSTIIIKNGKYIDHTGEYLVGMSHNDLVGVDLSGEHIQKIKEELLSNLKNRIK